MDLANQSPFQAELVALGDGAGADALAVVVKATFALGAPGDGGGSRLADEQAPVVLADAFRGEPGLSSLLEAGEVFLDKPRTDLVLRGSAFPHRKANEAEVRFQVGSHARTVNVLGDRVWERVLGLSRKSVPKAFESMPLVWERAFGGWDKSHGNPAKHQYEPRNPVGRGFRARRSKNDVEGSPLPNMEAPGQAMSRPGSRPEPAGFGFVGRDWLPRRERAGTYDEAYMAERFPLLPADFDPRYHDRAPEEMSAETAPRPGEPISARGVHPSGELRATVPTVELDVSVVFKRKVVPLAMHLDTLLVDSELLQLRLSFSGSLRVQGELTDVVSVRVRGEARAS